MDRNQQKSHPKLEVLRLKRLFLRTISIDVEVDGEESGHSGGRVVAGATGQVGQGADSLSGVGVEDDGLVVGENEEVAVGEEVDEGVEIVFSSAVVFGFSEEIELVECGRAFELVVRRDDLVVESIPAADDDEAAVW